MDYLDYISRYSDVIQMSRGINLISELNQSEGAPICKFIIEKCKAEDRIGFYREASIYISTRYPHGSCTLLSEEELNLWEQRFKEGADQKEYKINQAKNAGLKDSYRLNILDLANYYYRAGDFSNSMKLLIRAKDLSVTFDQQFELYSRMALTSLHRRNLSFAQNSSQRVLTLSGIPEKQLVTSSIIMGVCSIENGNYKNAAEYFLRVSGENNQELAINSDLAAYISICALASMDRSTINNEIVQSKSFLAFAEEEPKLIELLECFLTCKFFRLINILEDVKKQLKNDLFIGKSINNLCDEIKNRCLVQFMKAFKRIRISELASNFACSQEEIEEKLAKLIMDGKIDARIDAHLKLVTSRQVDEKNKINQSVLHTGRSLLRNTQLILLRMSMIQEGVVVKGK